MKGALHILDRTGHNTLEWDTEVEVGPLSPEYVATEFDRLVSQGHLGYGTTKEGVNEQIRKFDPVKTPRQYEKVTLTPPMQGG